MSTAFRVSGHPIQRVKNDMCDDKNPHKKKPDCADFALQWQQNKRDIKIRRPSGFQRRRGNGEIDDDGGEGIKRGSSQVATKEDLHAARGPLCDHFLLFFLQGRRTSFRAAHKR